MRLHRTERYLEELDEIIFFITQDSVNQAYKFERALDEALEVLRGDLARGFRKSFYVDEPNAHDFIFKGYVIPYRINESKNQVELLGIFKHNLWRY